MARRHAVVGCSVVEKDRRESRVSDLRPPPRGAEMEVRLSLVLGLLSMCGLSISMAVRSMVRKCRSENSLSPSRGRGFTDEFRRIGEMERE